jgi:hypothetical protein
VGYQVPFGSTTPGTLRLHRKLESAGQSIPVASGWQTITDGTNALTGSFQSAGGTTLHVGLHGGANVTIGGSARVVISGGSFSSEIVTVEPSTMGTGTSRIAQSGCVELPPTGSPVTYTVTAQGQGVGLLSSMTPTSGTNLIVQEHL